MRLHVAVFILCSRDTRPPRRSWNSNGWRMHPGIDPRDQIELPTAPRNLPGAEPHQRREHNEDRNAKHRKTKKGAGFLPLPSSIILSQAGFRHLRGHSYGMFRMSWALIGIMFEFRWNMTQSDPVSTIARMTMVKIKANMVHPPSARVFMCRK